MTYCIPTFTCSGRQSCSCSVDMTINALNLECKAIHVGIRQLENDDVTQHIFQSENVPAGAGQGEVEGLKIGLHPEAQGSCPVTRVTPVTRLCA